jgi:DNA (cytosine-5)-methyltransferase 1
MVLTIATDCSGIEAPIEALKQMKIPFRHLWSCDNDPFVQQSIAANYSPEMFFDDITKRNNSKLPSPDIYVCGFPCQPFSALGTQLGTRDARGNIMLYCIDTIKKTLPKVFILENVRRFKSIQKGQPFNYLLDELNAIKFRGKKVYNVYTDILNTKDYGIPQSRNRLFIIGIRRDVQKEEYKTPRVKKMKDLNKFIIDKKVDRNFIPCNSLKKNLKKIKYQKDYIITPFNYIIKPELKLCPTLVTNCSCFYSTTYNRNLTPKECLMLQGFKTKFKQVVSDTQLYKQVGNSISVNVLICIFQMIFDIINLNDFSTKT